MLNKKQLNDIRTLQNICEDHDEIRLKLNWDMLEERGPLNNDFFHYENDQLSGYLALYGFGDQYELCGMVHPEFRGKGTFTQLLSKAVISLKDRDARSLLINVPGTSGPGKTFASSIMAVYDFTEYEMKWDPSSHFPLSEEVTTREMQEEDIPFCIKLDVECFGQNHSDAETMMKQISEESTQKSLMIEADGRTVGKIRVQRLKGQSFIYGFAVDPSLQGIGIGRKALSRTVREESQWTEDIFLDVSATNSNALKLYERSGFRTIYSQDYYRYTI
ncbi:GNAT family N-acetyltransferase [Bacillus sp. Marseille-Q1617]|uniref:GNAT family N-acetyltransferase n=1 Tax=Bacillus sp. Marseille-Q1617 TaxID=2736887 RepID=UPI00158BFFC4|nr:GNAT family N-acetyltransferase [Bacillus sp. Marseille-Q1617]